MTQTATVTFVDPQIQKCPFHAYDDVRAKGPVYHDPTTGHYVITSYELLKEVSADVERLSTQAGIIRDRAGPLQALSERVMRENGYPLIDLLITGDPPEHAFHRSLVETAFSAARVKKMEDYLQEVVEDRIAALPARGPINIHDELSVLVPVTVIADQLGVSRADIHTFKKWSDCALKRLDPNQSEAELTEALMGYCALQNYIAAKAEAYRAAPADCLLSDLVHAQSDGRSLTVTELVNIASILIVAGNETTTSAISSAILRLAKDQELQDRLRGDPAQIANFVEEVLRLESPVQGMFRRTKEAMVLGGVSIPAGSILMLKFGAANRDPAKFEDPAAVDLARRNGRQHVAFGYGPHFCIGHQLARSETRITVTELLGRMDNIRLADQPDAVEYLSNYVTYGPIKLTIDYEKRH